MRDSATNGVTYLHGDHLGSVSLATNSAGAVVSRQDFDPWGKARGTSTIPQTSLNYTGQRLDGTGLLYYHALYTTPAHGSGPALSHLRLSYAASRRSLSWRRHGILTVTNDRTLATAWPRYRQLAHPVASARDMQMPR